MNKGTIAGIAIALLASAALLIAILRWQGGRRPPPSTDVARSAPSAPSQPPAVEEVVPGKLRVRIFSHVIHTDAGPVPCWTFMSDGFLAEGQQEIAFSVKREPGEAEDAYPRALLDFYATIYPYAVQKQFVTEGGTTQLNRGRPGLLRDDLHGVLYTPGQPLDGVTAPGPFLTAVVLTGPELDVVAQLGHVRLMSLLGSRYRFFPTTPWLDRRRAEITRPEAMASSLLGRTRRYRLSGAEVRMETGAARKAGHSRVVLTLRRDAGKRFAEDLKKLGPEIGLAVMVDVDPEADAILLWEPGQTAPSGISRPGATGERLAGNFLMISNLSDQDGAKMLEDGFALLSTKETWSKVRAAIEEGRPIEVPGAGELMGFALAWAQETFTNPVDGTTMVGRFRTYGSSPAASGAPGASGAVKTTGIRLLQPDHELNGRIEAAALAEYIKRADAVVESTLGGDAGGAGFDVVVQFELSPPRTATVQVAGWPQGGLPAAMKDLTERLQGVAVPEIKGGPVRFLVGYAVHGGTGEAIP